MGDYSTHGPCYVIFIAYENGSKFDCLFQGWGPEKVFCRSCPGAGIMEINHRQTYKNQTVCPRRQRGRRIDAGLWRSIGTAVICSDSLTNQARSTQHDGCSSGAILNNLLVNSGSPKKPPTLLLILSLIGSIPTIYAVWTALRAIITIVPNPYKAKNTRLDTLEELLLIKGMSPDILLARKNEKGSLILWPFIVLTRGWISTWHRKSTHGTAGISEDVVNRIIQQRESVEYKCIVICRPY